MIGKSKKGELRWSMYEAEQVKQAEWSIAFDKREGTT